MSKSITTPVENIAEIVGRTRPSLKMREDEAGTLQVEINGDFGRISNPTNGKAVAVGLARIIHQTPGISFRLTGSAGLTAEF